eukprot:scaffold1862_cov576-Prasinococcus_capsulatus_cf.AAC.4
MYYCNAGVGCAASLALRCCAADDAQYTAALQCTRVWRASAPLAAAASALPLLRGGLVVDAAQDVNVVEQLAHVADEALERLVLGDGLPAQARHLLLKVLAVLPRRRCFRCFLLAAAQAREKTSTLRQTQRSDRAQPAACLRALPRAGPAATASHGCIPPTCLACSYQSPCQPPSAPASAGANPFWSRFDRGRALDRLLLLQALYLGPSCSDRTAAAGTRGRGAGRIGTGQARHELPAPPALAAYTRTAALRSAQYGTARATSSSRTCARASSPSSSGVRGSHIPAQPQRRAGAERLEPSVCRPAAASTRVSHNIVTVCLPTRCGPPRLCMCTIATSMHVLLSDDWRTRHNLS